MPKKNISNLSDERKMVLDKLLKILEVTDTNQILNVKILDDNEEKQNQIKELEDDIRKYFLYSKWNYFTNKNRKQNYLSLVKSIFKDMKINIPIEKNKLILTNEREDVLKKLLNILGINESNKTFNLKMLDDDVEKQKEIIDLETEIKKYFDYTKLSYFTNKIRNKNSKRDYLSIIKIQQ